MKRLLLAALLLVPLACAETEPLALALRDDVPELQPIHATIYSNIREKRRVLIRDPETWAAVWAEMVSMGDPKTPPFVDFSREDVVVVAMGEQRTGGYSILVDGLTRTGGSTSIIVKSTVPGPLCDRSEVVNAPLDAVRIRKVTGAVGFEERTVVRSCQ